MDTLTRRLMELVKAAGGNEDTPLHAVSPAWPLPERELRGAVVGRMDGSEAHELQKRICVVSLRVQRAVNKASDRNVLVSLRAIRGVPDAAGGRVEVMRYAALCCWTHS